jgi:hypothetical protein
LNKKVLIAQPADFSDAINKIKQALKKWRFNFGFKLFIEGA